MPGARRFRFLPGADPTADPPASLAGKCIGSSGDTGNFLCGAQRKTARNARFPQGSLPNARQSRPRCRGLSRRDHHWRTECHLLARTKLPRFNRASSEKWVAFQRFEDWMTTGYPLGDGRSLSGSVCGCRHFAFETAGPRFAGLRGGRVMPCSRAGEIVRRGAQDGCARGGLCALPPILPS